MCSGSSITKSCQMHRCALDWLLNVVIAAAGLDKQFACSSNAVDGQSTVLSIVCLPSSHIR